MSRRRPGPGQPAAPLTPVQRAALVDHMLAEAFPDPQAPLVHRDPYTLLIAVLLSAQCTDARVNTVTPALFALADRPAPMAEQDCADVLAIIRPCGLGERKAAAIVGLSQLLCERHGGQVPADLAALEALPGVGHKTAQVVLAQAFGIPSFPVDTHIHRVSRRWGLSDGRSVVQTERDCKRLFPRERWNALHLQMIFWGRAHCGARSCDGTKCAICQALQGL